MKNNEQVMNGLLGKIFSVMSHQDSINANAPARNVFISYAAPGIAISSSDLNFGNLDTREGVARQAKFSYLVNTIPDNTGFWSSTGKMTWDIYRKAISNIRLSQPSLRDEDTIKLKKAIQYLEVTKTVKDPFDDTEKTITKSSPQLLQYEKYLGEYETALLEYNKLLVTASADDALPEDIKNFNLNGPIYKRKLTNAYAAWSGEGNKDNVEKARAIISMINGIGSEQIYNELKAKLDHNRREDTRLGTYYPTYYFPDQALDGNSWTKLSFKESETNSFSSKSQVSTGGGGSRSWFFGLFSAGASAQYSENTEHYECDTSNLEVSFEVMQLPVLRPWYDMSIFETRNWKWADGSKDLVSDGMNPPAGLMPLYVSSVIVSRNLRIKMDTSSEKNRSSLTKISGSASAGFGFFSLKGNYSKEYGNSSHNFRTTSNGIECDGMQIIGFICNKLPKSPNPDPSLIW